MDNNSHEDLIREAESMKSLASLNRGFLDCAKRLKPTLLFINDFSAVLALCFGADAKLTVIVWGSIRVMLCLAASREDMIGKIISLLEELGQTLPKIKAYEDSKSVNPALEAIIIDVYTEVICFYSRCVQFFGAENMRMIRSNAWEALCEDLRKTIQAVKGLSNSISYSLELAMMEESNKGEKEHDDLLVALASLQKSKIKGDEAINVCDLPENLDTPFWGRDGLVEETERALGQGLRPLQHISFALNGIGGAHKTKVAYHYARLYNSIYDNVLQIASADHIKPRQRFKELQTILWPEEVKEGRVNASAILRIKTWFSNISEYTNSAFSTAQVLNFESYLSLKFAPRTFY